MFHEPMVLYGLAAIAPPRAGHRRHHPAQRQTALAAKTAEVDLLTASSAQRVASAGTGRYEGLGMDFRTRGRRR
jgi:hypothetical protein